MNKVKDIGIGCEQLGGFDWDTKDDRPFEVVDEAWDNNIRLFDTAGVYGLGKSEINLSKILGARRHEALIATKCGLKWNKKTGSRAHVYVDNSPKSLEEDISNSLKRLKIDRLPIVFLHRPDNGVSLRHSLDYLMSLKENGKIDAIGLSNHSLEDIKSVSDMYNIEYCQLEFNFLNRQNLPTIRLCNKKRIKVMTSSSIARGILSEKYLSGFREFNENDRRSRLNNFSKESYEQNYKIVGNLSQLAKSRGYNVSELSLRWILDSAHCDYALVGFKNIEQFRQISSALISRLDVDTIEKLNLIKL